MKNQTANTLTRFFGSLVISWAHRQVAALGFSGLKAVPGLGKKGREDVIKWLADYGMVPEGKPTDHMDQSLFRRVLIAHLSEKLACFGYQIVPLGYTVPVCTEEQMENARTVVRAVRHIEQGML